MSEQEHNAPVQETLSPRRRTALVSYLAVLFAAAFLFVALVMVMETKRLKTMNRELQDSSQKTSASLTNNINALQDENRRLSDAVQEKDERILALEAAAAEAAASAEGLQAQIDALKSEKEELLAEKAELELRIRSEGERTENAVQVSELLHRALAADESGDLEGLQALLDQIEPLKDLLSPTEQEIYEELKIA